MYEYAMIAQNIRCTIRGCCVESVHNEYNQNKNGKQLNENTDLRIEEKNDVEKRERSRSYLYCLELSNEGGNETYPLSVMKRVGVKERGQGHLQEESEGGKGKPRQ